MTKLIVKNRGVLAGNLGLAVALSTGCSSSMQASHDPPRPRVAAASDGNGWRATFPAELIHVALKSAAAYTRGEVTLNLDSSTPLTSLPNATGAWTVQPNTVDPFQGRVVFQDSVPGVIANPTSREQPYLRTNGTIAAVLTVNQELTDVRISAKVNATGGPAGGGTSSRQGAMLRWNGANEYITCFVDFGTNQVYLYAARSAFEFETLGTQPAALDNRKTYRVNFEVRGQDNHCTVYDGTAVVADTGTISDARIPASGIAGVMFELSQGKPEVPLEGSASEIESVSLLGPVVPPR
jgi:hypothetical protein